MKNITHQFSGKSLLELREKFGTGSSGFWDNTWWLKEDWAKEKPEVGVYGLDLSDELVDLTFDEQKKKLKKGFEVAHPAIIAEAILTHFKETGERLCENYWVRTSSIPSAYAGCVSCVGNFDENGLDVGRWGGYRRSSLGVGASRKLRSLKPRKIEPLDSLSLEKRVERIEKWIEFWETVETPWKIKGDE